MMSLSYAAEKVSSAIDALVCWLTIILSAGFTCLIFTAVLSRYFFDFSILFSQEVSKLLFIWACFLAATITYKRNAHIRFQFIDTFLSAKLLLISELAIHLLSLVFFITIFWKSVSYVSQIWQTYFPLIGISQGWLYVSVNSAALVFIIHNISFLLQTLAGPAELNGQRPGDDGGVEC